MSIKYTAVWTKESNQIRYYLVHVPHTVLKLLSKPNLQSILITFIHLHNHNMGPNKPSKHGELTKTILKKEHF